MLASIIMRGLERESKIVSLRITISDRPGMLGEIASEIGRCGANILEVYHRRFYLDVPAKGTLVDIVIETKDRAHADETVGKLKKRGFKVERMNGVAGEYHDIAHGGIVNRPQTAAAFEALKISCGLSRGADGSLTPKIWKIPSMDSGHQRASGPCLQANDKS